MVKLLRRSMVTRRGNANPPGGRGLRAAPQILLTAILLTACATKPPPPIQARVPDTLRASCEKPAPDAVQTVGDLAGFSLRQDAAIDVCDAKRAALVSIIDGVNQVVAPKRKRFGLF